ncbi:MAG TPA: hypothetical protein VGX50_12275 [Longimicrobium sp.]|jgi:hypothetical protein|nr:hypothetical protein [Longimicrobium sp.]
MGLLDFFSRKDPTHDWPASGAGPLRFDVVRGEMNGIAFDAPFDALRVLGKPSNPRPVETRLFAYAPLGLAVAMGANSEVLVFTCVFQAGAGGEADEFPGFLPCRIALRNERGTLLEVTSTTSAGLLETVLGPLTRRGTEDGYVASLVVGSVWLGFSFDHAGGLTLLDIEPAEYGTGGVD